MPEARLDTLRLGSRKRGLRSRAGCLARRASAANSCNARLGASRRSLNRFANRLLPGAQDIPHERLPIEEAGRDARMPAASDETDELTAA
jgi:hypothetical protein